MQAVVSNDDAEEAFTQLQVPLSASYPWAMPPLLQPLVVAGPFGSGKRPVLQRLVQSLPDVLAVPKVVTSKPHTQGRDEGAPAPKYTCTTVDTTTAAVGGLKVFGGWIHVSLYVCCS